MSTNIVVNSDKHTTYICFLKASPQSLAMAKVQISADPSCLFDPSIAKSEEQKVCGFQRLTETPDDDWFSRLIKSSVSPTCPMTWMQDDGSAPLPAGGWFPLHFSHRRSSAIGLLDQAFVLQVPWIELTTLGRTSSHANSGTPSKVGSAVTSSDTYWTEKPSQVLDLTYDSIPFLPPPAS